MKAVTALPSFERARKRANASTVLGGARQLDAAKDQYALEHEEQWKREGRHDIGSIKPTWDDRVLFLAAGGHGGKFRFGGYDVYGNSYRIGALNEPLRVNPKTKALLSEASGGDAFWGPFS